SSCTFRGACIQHGIAEPVRAVPGARLEILATGFNLQLYKFTASRLRPHAIDTIPALSGDNLRHLLPSRSRIPHARRVGDNLDVWVLAKDAFCGGVAARVHHRAGYAAHENDIAFIVELLSKPFGWTGAGPFLVDSDVIGARLRYLGVPGDERYAFLAGGAD